MIGPSSTNGLTHEEGQARSMKRKVFEDLDFDEFCEEVCESPARKRYLQELETPVELIGSNQIIETTGLFSPMSAQEAVDECQVARLEVLLVDGTNCTWTTVSDIPQEGNITELTSSSGSRQEEESFQINGYWGNSEAGKSNVGSTMSSQQQCEDQENGNLSWLLDFKLDPFIEAADDKASGPTYKENHHGNKSKLNGRVHGTVSHANDVRKTYNNQESNSTLNQDANQISNYTNDNRNLASTRCNGPKKPPFTYTELIEHALQERGELTVSAIYQWISEHFPYYKSNDDRWKNSVRHNLSINPHFRKGSKAPHGAGHLWAIANRDSRPRQPINAVQNLMSRQTIKGNETSDLRRNASQIIPMDEVEAATASISQPPDEEVENIANSVTLEHCAEQILSGIKKEVEVQYLVPMMVANNEQDSTQPNEQTVQTELQCPVKEDFLNPVSKEVVAEECGLISEGYLVTDLNPSALGLNMVEPEIITPENLFGEELNFQFYELSSPSQLQSA